ncbi:uncharacterized protein V1513DRAFT_443072 [Lipomyces chichibuensis]|uniref:uncharacterized protein n=1 Tax=Lipomyces chichibuensis TaxID=1546026 RepID=UPI00334400F2
MSRKYLTFIVQHTRATPLLVLRTLFLLMHLTYGSPARMTEIESWKHVNSVHEVRNLYCHQRGQVFLGLYNKTTCTYNICCMGLQRVGE